MILTGSAIQARLDRLPTDSRDPLVITPLPLDSAERSAQITSGSIDLRLGTWFAALLPSATAVVDLAEIEPNRGFAAGRVSQRYIPFGSPFVLHPRAFVLAVTLEWIRLPGDLAATVEGRSSLARRGLNIATATSVHPHFAGCLTLELANMGEVPISISPGMRICQLVLQEVAGVAPLPQQTSHSGYRRPVMTPVRLDEVARRLRPDNRAGVLP